MLLTIKQRYRISAETGIDPRTVKRIYAGEKTKNITRETVTQAAAELNYPAPPPLSKQP